VASKLKLRKMLAMQKYLLFMLAPIIIWFIIFCYVPIYGWIMAFVNYEPGKPLLASKFVGLKHFDYFIFKSHDFYNIMRNSLGLNFLNIVFSQGVALLFAILLNEIKREKFKKFVQSVSFIPYLVSWAIVAIVANVVYALLSLDSGMINALLLKLNIIDEPIYFMTNLDFS
jgi:putative aldouronate transport system permease protein